MHALLSDRQGRTLIIEPGIGWREDDGRYSLITNYSVLSPESTRDYIVPGDDRYERASKLLREYGDSFSVSDAFRYLKPGASEPSGTMPRKVSGDRQDQLKRTIPAEHEI